MPKEARKIEEEGWYVSGVAYVADRTKVRVEVTAPNKCRIALDIPVEMIVPPPEEEEV